MTPTDGLDLAGQSERDLRDFLKAHGIAIPSGQLFVIEIRSKDDARYASRFATTTIYTRPQQMEMMIRVLTTFRLHRIRSRAVARSAIRSSHVLIRSPFPPT